MADEINLDYNGSMLIKLIDRSFQEYCENNISNSDTQPESSWNEKDIIQTYDNYAYSPINLNNSIFKNNFSNLKDESFVKIRCMIQQPLSPEIYVGAYKSNNNGKFIWNTNKYREKFGDEVSDDNSIILWNRFVYKCIFIPFETNWVSKIGLERSIDREINDDFTRNHGIMQDDQYFFIKIYDQRCELKLHDNDKHNVLRGLKINDLIEVEGFFHNKVFYSKDEADQCEIKSVPTIHALEYRKLGDWNPYYDLISATHNDMDLKVRLIIDNGPHENVDKLRSSLIDYISRSVNNDRLTAEYILLCLCSSRFSSRCMKFHRFSINLFQKSGDTSKKGNNEEKLKEFGSKLLEKCEKLMPRVAKMNLTEKFLSEVNLSSSMEYLEEYDNLEKGFLQMASGTLLFIEEMYPLQPSNLNERAKRNIKIIEETLSLGEIGYCFSNLIINYEVDSPVILISNDVSQFKDHFTISLPIIDDFIENSDEDDIDDAELQKFRLWIACVASITEPLSIPPSTVEYISNYFVDARQKSSIDADTFSTWILLSRVYCFTLGESELSTSRWDFLMQMEEERRRRLDAALGNKW